MDNGRTITFRNIVSYGLGDFFGGGSYLIISLFFFYFLTEIAGIAPWLAGIAIGAGKVWDALAAPLMGFISDNTRTRLGRRRIYFVMGIMPIAVSFILLWLPVSWSNQYYKAFYYSLSYIFFCTVFSMVMVPYGALNADMTSDYKLRTRLSGARVIFSTAAALVAGTLPDIIIRRVSGDAHSLLTSLSDLSSSSGSALSSKLIPFIQKASASHVSGIDCSLQADRISSTAKLAAGSPEFNALLLSQIDSFRSILLERIHMGYSIMAIVFAVMFALPWIAVFLGTWECSNCGEQPVRKGRDLIRGIASVFRNKSFRKHLGMYIFAYTAIDILLVMMKFYFDYNLGREGLSMFALAVLVVSQIAAIPFYVRIANSRGKAYAYRIGLVIWGVGMAFAATVNHSTSVYQLAAISCVIGLGLSAGAMIPWALMPTVADVDELITGEKRAGVYAGSLSFARKLVQGLVVLPLVGQAVSAAGLIPGASQSSATLHSMKMLFIAAPLVCIALGFAVSLTFKITPAVHALLIEETERLRRGGLKRDVAPAAKIIVEEITGLPYEKLFRREG